MRDPLLSSARRRGWGRGLGTTRTGPSRKRLVAGALVFASLIAATNGGGANASMNLLNMLFPTTTRATAPTTTATTAPTTTSPTVAPPAPPTGALTDTGYTFVRLTFDTQAQWATLTLDGTEIKSSKVISTSGKTKVTSLGPTISVSGAGTAAIDFILKIAPGANTGLTMCKNYMGPTTVTVARRTDAPGVAATLANNGRNGYPPAGQCENRLHIDVSRAALIGPVRWPARVDARPLVLAIYFPWYTAENLLQDVYGPDQPTSAGNTTDPAAVASAMALAKQAGVDGWVAEYDGVAAATERLDSAYAIADARGDFKMAIHLDLAILSGWEGGRMSPGGLDAALQSVVARASHPSQLMSQGQPVIFVFGSTKVTLTAWREAMERLRTSTGYQPYIIADSDTLQTPGRYTFGTPDLTNKAALDARSADALNRYRLQPDLQGWQRVMWVAPVSPGYDDRRQNRPQPMYVDRANGQRYEDEWSAALASLPDWVLISTWNEYFEQSHVMPGATTGTRALTQTGQWAPRFHITG